MAGLYGIYATKSKVHDEFKSYDNDSVLNYVTSGLRFLTGRGKESLKYTFFKDGEQKIVAGSYKSDTISDKIRKSDVLKATGLITKITYDKLMKSISSTSIDGYFVNKDELKKGPHDERFGVFDKKFSQIVESGDYHKALSFANMFFNGSIIKETEDSIIGVRTASGYKPLFIMEARDDGNDFVAMMSEDCIQMPFLNKDSSKKGDEFMGMDVLNVSQVGRGQLVKVDKDGIHTTKSLDDPAGSGLKINAAYDPHEATYILNKNSTFENQSVVKIRNKIGENLFDLYEDDLKRTDLVGYVPDTPIDIAIGMHRRSGIGYDEVLQKDRYNRKSPQRGYGDRGQSNLLLMSEEVVDGKNIIVIDDSVNEGNHLKLIRSRMKDHADKVNLVSGEIPIIKEEQVGFYSEDRNLIARDVFSTRNISTISDFNREVSDWADMSVYYNTPKNLAKSLGIRLDNLEIPKILRNMDL